MGNLGNLSPQGSVAVSRRSLEEKQIKVDGLTDNLTRSALSWGLSQPVCRPSDSLSNANPTYLKTRNQYTMRDVLHTNVGDGK
jgi:hypothetical protein